MTTTARHYAAIFTQAELEAKLRDLALETMDGKSLTGWGAGDTSAQKQIWQNMSPTMRLSDVGQALTIKAPATYPPETYIPIVRTKLAFRNPHDMSE